MVQPTELGYLGISVSDADAWKDYATQVIGLEIVDENDADRFYLRADQWHHRFTVHIGGEDDCIYTGYRVADQPALEAMGRQLEDAGISFRIGSEALAEERKVLGLITLQDPDGNPLEIFYGPQVDAHKPFHPGRPMFGGFATGGGGMGHILIAQSDLKGGLQFYRNLGFVGDVEYKVPLPDGGTADPVFLHVNDRQHTLAFGAPPSGKRLNHLMLQYTDLKDLGISYDTALKRQLPMPMTLGMHANDETLSFYIANPSEWTIELGWGGREAPSMQEYYQYDVFGHAAGASGLGFDRDASKA